MANLGRLTGVERQSLSSTVEGLERLTGVKTPGRTSVPGAPDLPGRGEADGERTERGPGVSGRLPGQESPAFGDRRLGEPSYGRPPSHTGVGHGRDKDRDSVKDRGPSYRSSGSGRSR